MRGAYASTVLVENKPGASARIAVEYVKNAEPDGSVMLFTPDFPMTLYPHSFKSLSYEPLTRLHAGRSGHHLDAELQRRARRCPPSVKTLGDYVQWCKANPDKASYGTTSAGATPHFAGVMLSNEVEGAAQSGALPRRRAGAAGCRRRAHPDERQSDSARACRCTRRARIRILAVTGAKRSQFMPDVPTAKESGYDVVIESWLGVFLPPKVPADVRARAEHRDEAKRRNRRR